MAVEQKKIRVVKSIDSTWMSIPNLCKHLQETKKVTGHGQPISLVFTHYRVNMGYLPHAMGGNIIEVVLYQDTKYVRLTDRIREKSKAGRKIGSKSAKRPKSKSLVFRVSNGEDFKID